MKRLELNPQKHDIVLDIENPAYNKTDDLPVVVFEFAETYGTLCVQKNEAKKIGEWFLKLSKEIK